MMTCRYALQPHVMTECHHRNDNWYRAVWAINCCNRWLGVRLQFLSALIVLMVVIVVGVSHQHLGGAMVGFLMVYALQATKSLMYVVRGVVVSRLRLCGPSKRHLNLASARRMLKWL